MPHLMSTQFTERKLSVRIIPLSMLKIIEENFRISYETGYTTFMPHLQSRVLSALFSLLLQP